MSRRKGTTSSHFLTFNRALYLSTLPLLLLSLPKFVQSDGNIGCLYSDVCDSRTERCFDDSSLGRCVYIYNSNDEDLTSYELDYSDLEKLKEQLQQLQELGYNWKHSYTQCIMQTQLNAIKFDLPFDGSMCERMEMEREGVDPVRELQYKQTSDMRRNDFGIAKQRRPLVLENEGVIKYVPEDEEDMLELSNRGALFGRLGERDSESELINQLREQSSNKRGGETYKKSAKSTLSRYRGTPLYIPPHNRGKFKLNEVNDEEDDENGDDWSESLSEEGVETPENNMKAYTEAGSIHFLNRKPDYDVYDKILDQYDNDLLGFQRSERLDVKKPGPNFKVNNYAFGNMNTKTDQNDDRYKNQDDELIKRKAMVDYSEKYAKELPVSEYEYVPSYGPSFRTDNSAYITIETDKKLQMSDASTITGTLTRFKHYPAGLVKAHRVEGNKLILSVKPNLYTPSAADVKKDIEDSFASGMLPGLSISNIRFGHPDDDSDRYQYINPDYAYVRLEEPIRNYIEAEKIVRQIEIILKLPRGTLNGVKEEAFDIAFKVGPNGAHLNASQIAQKIETSKSEIEEKLKIHIVSVGIGDQKDKLPSAVRIQGHDNGLFMLTFIVCGIIGAVLVSTITLYLVKKQSKIKEKLLVSRDEEVGKSFQGFCRGKVSTKTNQEGNTATGQRITSLSRESDNSPSSRSSTSSWSEEPMTNMDITTGHMVLAYMEDHLTNKARLDTEWVALCAYDADPCSVAIAQFPENIRKNRYVNAVPYDHARVILNALSNVNGNDYINASTITDHDPRNAAYIATQGPLENTVCDFWQMIWEQGCVVIVMLTKLIENDTSICYRYWPLEGSELYHIYEVHLVSEHIWCDDFIVRSFYLKNLKTTETRTVTQFHFLTWPEGGIPSATKPLLEFRRKVNKSFRGRSCPIVVHCSDGVGRTGSYLLLDMVLNRISKGAKEIDIAATLEHIRDQRAGAVCTKQQFQFVLSAVAEEVQAVLRALPQQQVAQEQGPDNVPLVQVSVSQPDPVPTTSGVTSASTGNQTSSSSPSSKSAAE